MSRHAVPRPPLASASLLLVLGFVGGLSDVRAEDPPTDRTDVVATPDAPIQPGRNVVWCATIQLAWDAAADAVSKDGRLEVGPPAPLKLVEALNRRAFPHRDVDEAATLVVGGLVKDGVLDRLRDAWRSRFPERPVPSIEAGPDDAIGFAALFQDLPFETPFRVLPDGLRFPGADAPVKAFGMIHDDAADDVEAMAHQVVAWPPPETSRPDRRGGGPVVELVPRDTADRILLSALDPGPTLETAWQALAGRLEHGRAARLECAETLEIPRVRLDLEHRFEEFVGAPLPQVPGGSVGEMRQSVRFSLTEQGASVASDALIVASLGLATPLVFDRPFLLALMRRGATRPYLLVWVANADLLEANTPGQTATRQEAAPFVGRWTIDRERTLKSLLEKLAGEEMDDEERADLRESYGELLDQLTLTLEIGADGHVSLRSVLKGGTDEDVEWEKHALSGRLVVEEGRVRMVLDPEEGDEEGSTVLVTPTVVDGCLELPLPTLPLVLKHS